MNPASFHPSSARLARIGFAALGCAAVALVAPSAHAAGPAAAGASATGSKSLVVLAIDSDDALDQAAAVTGALRTRLRSLPGFALQETAQSLATATAGLRCQTRPDAACQVRIADLVKADRYVWGVMRKVKGVGGAPGKVDLELHYFERGKPDQRLADSFSENVRDARDPYLEELSDRALNQFLDLKLAKVTLRAAGMACDIQVDDGRTVALKGGSVAFKLTPGAHTFTPQAPCAFKPSQADVPANGDITVDLMRPVVAAPPAAVKAPSKPFPVQTVVGVGVAALGVGAGIYSILQYSAFNDTQSAVQLLNRQIPNGLSVCDYAASNASANDTNRDSLSKSCDKGRGQSARAWISAGLGVALITTGVILIVTDKSGSSKPTSDAARKAALRPQFRVDPVLGSTSGLLVSGTF